MIFLAEKDHAFIVVKIFEFKRLETNQKTIIHISRLYHRKILLKTMIISQEIKQYICHYH